VPPLSAGVTMMSVLLIRSRRALRCGLVMLIGMLGMGSMLYGSFSILHKRRRSLLGNLSRGGRQVDGNLSCLNCERSLMGRLLVVMGVLWSLVFLSLKWRLICSLLVNFSMSVIMGISFFGIGGVGAKFRPNSSKSNRSFSWSSLRAERLRTVDSSFFGRWV